MRPSSRRATRATSFDDPVYVFAVCAGRYLAEVDMQWALSDPDADRTEAMRDQMLSILDALSGDAGGTQVLAWRVEARAAQAALLNRAVFAHDAQAGATAARYRSRCADLIVMPRAPAPPATAPEPGATPQG